MRKAFLTGAAALTALVAVPFLAAQAEPTGVVAYRQTAMKTFGAHLNAIKTLIQQDPSLIDQAAIHAQAMQHLAVVIPTMFPEGSEDPESDALPSIWEDPDGFEAASNSLAETSAALVAAAETGDVQAVTQAFATVGKEGCGTCHSDYRAKDD